MYAKILKIPVCLFIFAVMISLPALDEIIGRQQFKAICEKKFRNKNCHKCARERSIFDEANICRNSGEAGSSELHEWRYADTKNDEVLISHKVFYASGGILARMGFSADGRPNLFNATCEPKKVNELNAVMSGLKISMV